MVRLLAYKVENEKTGDELPFESSIINLFKGSRSVKRRVLPNHAVVHQAVEGMTMISALD
jgi:hypothetical protein